MQIFVRGTRKKNMKKYSSKHQMYMNNLDFFVDHIHKHTHTDTIINSVGSKATTAADNDNYGNRME